MKLQSLIEELERQKPLKQDEPVNSSQIRMVLVENQPRFQIKENDSFSITEPCHSQIAEKLEIPLKYYHRMDWETPELLAENVNTWLKRSEKEFFIRRL